MTISEQCADLSKFLEALPPVPAGKLRVYRGQPRDFGVMLASAHRSSHNAVLAGLWKAYTHHIAEEYWHSSKASLLEADLITKIWPGLQGHGGMIDKQYEFAMTIGFEAVAQHYGPGSAYLDVSTSLEPALWFAFHEIEEVEVQFPHSVVYSGARWLDYSPVDSGWLYVFDVAPWSPSAPLKHGNLISLLDAEPPFRSTRMVAQTGCLLWADTSQDKGDLTAFCVAKVKLNLETMGLPGIHREHHDLFPDPSQDEWYANLLSVPLVPRKDPGEPSMLVHPLSVSVYVPKADGDPAEKITRLIQVLDPYLLYPIKEEYLPLESVSRLIPDADLETLSSIVPFLMDGPVLHSTPPAGKLWNHSLLATPRDEMCPVFRVAQRNEPVGAVSLNNVLIEFSPLERLGWAPDSTTVVPRAAWLITHDDQFVFTFFEQVWSSGPADEKRPAGMRILGPSLVKFDKASERFLWKGHKSQTWFGFEEFQPLDKPFFVTLEILRHTSSAPVISAVPMLGMHTRTNDYVHLAMQSLRLYEAVRPETVEMMGHLRLLLTGTDHPFLGGFSRLDQVADRWRYVELRGSQYYADFRLADIQHQVGTS
jgi:hypothetical protein